MEQPIMNTFKHQPIICGTDFSEQAQHAANVAGTLAKRLRTRFVLVRGVDERGEIPPKYWPQLVGQDRPQLEAEITRLRTFGLEPESQLVGGALGEGIARYAAKAEAALLVVGSSGK